MYTSTKSFQDINSNSTRNYIDFRCLDPVAVNTTSPWFPRTNICPCNPKDSFPTGRGYTACPTGFTEKNITIDELEQNVQDSKPIQHNVPHGSLFPVLNQESKYNVFSPPQFEPRPYMNIGYTYRNGA